MVFSIITIMHIPPYSPNLNPVENLWDELREKSFSNKLFKNMNDVECHLSNSLGVLENNCELIASITGFEWIVTAATFLFYSAIIFILVKLHFNKS